jgi:hypothetical protein
MPFRADTKYLTSAGDKAQVLMIDAPGQYPLAGFVITAGVRDFCRWTSEGVHQTDPNNNLAPYTITVSAAMAALASAAGVPAGQRIQNTIRQWIVENYQTLRDVF